MSLIIAILIGAYLLIRIGNDKINSRISADKGERWEQALHGWQASVTDERLEEEIELFIYEKPLEAAQKSESLCSCIPKHLKYNKETLSRILLAEHGKIRKMDALFGIEMPIYDHSKPTLIIQQQYMEIYQFVVWLKDFLEKNGAPKVDMFFELSYSGKDSPKYFNLNDIYNLSATSDLLLCGTYEWEPQNITAYYDRHFK